MYCGHVSAAAAIQLDTCSSNFLIQEYSTTRLHREILKNPIRLERGYIEPPREPGLGVELNEDTLVENLSKRS